MPPRKKDLPEKWQQSSKALRAVQVAFYVDEQVQNKIRHDACMSGVSPSDMIREIIDLPVHAPPKRPRLTASFSDEDYTLLAKRYGLDPNDQMEIRRRVMQELIEYSND